jgi:hypothetical protein
VLILVAFVAHKGSQPMQQDGANGMSYWQFMRERIGAIRELPAKCQQMHFTGHLIAVPVYPVLYTLAFRPSFALRRESFSGIATRLRLASRCSSSSRSSVVERSSFKRFSFHLD